MSYLSLTKASDQDAPEPINTWVLGCVCMRVIEIQEKSLFLKYFGKYFGNSY